MSIDFLTKHVVMATIVSLFTIPIEWELICLFIGFQKIFVPKKAQVFW